MPKVAAYITLTVESGPWPVSRSCFLQCGRPPGSPSLTSAGRARLLEDNALLEDRLGPSCDAPERPQSVRVSRPIELQCRKLNFETASAPGWEKGEPHYSSPTCLALGRP